MRRCEALSRGRQGGDVLTSGHDGRQSQRLGKDMEALAEEKQRHEELRAAVESNLVFLAVARLLVRCLRPAGAGIEERRCCREGLVAAAWGRRGGGY